VCCGASRISNSYKQKSLDIHRGFFLFISPRLVEDKRGEHKGGLFILSIATSPSFGRVVGQVLNVRYFRRAGLSTQHLFCSTTPKCATRPKSSLPSGFKFHASLPSSLLYPSPGTLIVNVLPFPTSLATLAVPPCASAICFTIASPNPVPPNSRLRDNGRSAQLAGLFSP
jgi:hypothetical protein